MLAIFVKRPQSRARWTPAVQRGTTNGSERRQRFAQALLGAVTLMAAMLVAGCETPVSSAAFPNQSGAPTKVTLAPGDVVRLTFSAAPELNQTQMIRGDGKINLPQVGEVTAAGKPIAQLQTEVAALYKPQLRNSEVLVTLESGITRVYMAGSLQRPGPLVLDRPTTLLQAIMQAGGPTPFSNMRRVQVIRLVNGRQVSQVIDLRPTLAGERTRPFYVRDGDIVTVPQTAF
jgi:polysaccharide export outer membrane protein